MYHRTIDYGIDLGTTNSSIARMAGGRPQIVKSDEQSDTTPSAVYYTKAGQCLAGAAALARMRMDMAKGCIDNALVEFKTKMGTDQIYRFPSVDRAFTPEDLSSQILKTLRGYVHDDDIRTAVIAVPAAFGQTQVEATQRAAELAGLEQVELIPEPLAASLAYAIDKKNTTGRWLVFDLGGGTFDAVLMAMQDGIMKVVDIAGDQRLGGKDMDYLIVDQIIIPKLSSKFVLKNLLADPDAGGRLRRLLKNLYAEEAKIRLSRQENVSIEIADELGKDDRGAAMTDICISLDRAELERLVKPMIDRALKISADVCRRNNTDPADLSAVLLIGGPTYMPCVRDRLTRELCPNVDTSVDPMTAVALGAAVYAATMPNRIAHTTRDLAKAALTLAFPETTVETSVTVGIKAERGIAKGTEIEISTTDGRWKSGRMVIEKDAIAIPVVLTPGQPNCFNVALFTGSGTRIACEPDSFTVMQGIRIDSVPLPFDICAEVVIPEEGDILKPVARRGDILPVTGIIRNCRTRSVLRPGQKDDVMTIPVYEGEEYTRPLYNRFIGELRITGDQVKHTVPAGSDVTVTMRIDTSRRKTVSAYIECIDQTFEGVMAPLQKAAFDPAEMEHGLESARGRLNGLCDIPGIVEEIGKLIKDLNRAEVSYEIAGIERDGLEAVCDLVKELHKKLDAIEKTKANEIAAGRFMQEMDTISRTVKQDGSESQRIQLRKIQDQAAKAVVNPDKVQIQALLCAGRGLYWEIVNAMPDYWINSFHTITRTFDTRRWANETQAKNLLSRGKDLLTRGYDDSLRQIVGGLRELSRFETEEIVRMDVLETK